MRTKNIVGLPLLTALTIISSCLLNCRAVERDATLYIGTKKCSICHKKDSAGDQYGVWKEGPHAKAFEKLGTEEAKKIGAKVGVDDPQKSGKCLKCHATAYNFTEEVQVKGEDGAEPKITAEDGVTCESCHGPGENYKSKSVMKDRQKSIDGGMIYPATKSCELCHNDKSPTWKPDRYTTKDGKTTGFDVEQAHKKIAHPKPAE